MNYLICILVIAGGVFGFLGAYKQWGFYIRSSKYKRFAKIFGEKSARIFYMILGAMLIIMGIVFAIGELFGWFSIIS